MCNLSKMYIANAEAQGEVKGRDNEKLASARRLMAMKAPIDMIAAATELPVERLKQIARDSGIDAAF